MRQTAVYSCRGEKPRDVQSMVWGLEPSRPAAGRAFKMSMAAWMLVDCPRLREQEESKISIIMIGFRAYVCTR